LPRARPADADRPVESDALFLHRIADLNVESEAFVRCEVRALTAESWRKSADDPEPRDQVRLLGDEDLIDLLFTQEDRLPLTAVDEIVARGPRLAGTLSGILIDPRNWDEPRPAWWAPIHATFILAAIDDPAYDPVLLSAMRDAKARGNDWIIGAMPAILGARGPRLRPTLMGILANRTEPEGVRCAAIDGLAAGTFVDPEARNDVFARIGEVFTTATDPAWVREHAGQVLLDFQVHAYEQALLDFAEAAVATLDTEPANRIPGAIAFDVDDVSVAFLAPQDLSRYQDSWLDFYDEAAIAARQRRWREEAERAERQRVAQASWKVGRNDPCPCGSGRKYKKCCLGTSA
jgi:hypothetical protein